MLMELQKSGEISKELKYISKLTLNKLEKFLIEKVEAKLKFESLDDVLASNIDCLSHSFNEFLGHIKKAEQLSADRIKHLKAQLLKMPEGF